ncbi:hypothetical protein HF086_011935 [Spodoptera exigua]|uniref:BED-type domain-containing protein n=1 Tax=Spodoptera exigua TaxID=7107 RepID=A0A922M937_SPOEX|nr:hypothetical protein HF086_011935 [Spodoptera exigua]
MRPRGKSVAWDHFTDKGQQMAVCNICKIQLSFKSSVSNLTKHLKRKHPFISLVGRNEVPAPVIAAQTSQQPPPSDQVQSSPSTQTAGIIRQVEGQPGPSTNLVRLAQPGSRTIASYIYKKNADKCKSDIDKLIMNLFIMDFQPFRIVEVKGFRQLIQYAFSFYTIPTRKYFSNNLLPSRYESLKVSKMAEVANDVESISITADIWTSSTTDSYMGITGHYISKNEITLKSILLDCVVRRITYKCQLSNRTAANNKRMASVRKSCVSSIR